MRLDRILRVRQTLSNACYVCLCQLPKTSQVTSDALTVIASHGRGGTGFPSALTSTRLLFTEGLRKFPYREGCDRNNSGGTRRPNRNQLRENRGGYTWFWWVLRTSCRTFLQPASMRPPRNFHNPRWKAKRGSNSIEGCL